MKERLAKYNKKLVGKVPLIESKKTFWDQLALEATKFVSCLEFVQDEYEIDNVSSQKCKTVSKELIHRTIEAT